jgi:hypothetical protein
MSSFPLLTHTGDIFRRKGRRGAIKRVTFALLIFCLYALVVSSGSGWSHTPSAAFFRSHIV